MIPLTLTGDLQETLLDYLTTTFNFQDAGLETALAEFLTQENGGGMFQGPYLQLRLPFRKVVSTSDTAELLEIQPGFTPYVHQVKAFERLTSKEGHEPQPTIITTGTGSGKTECFLFPILDHCYRHHDDLGIKAIILYPMNALATDQAKRLAGIIWEDERLRGQVRAGLYVGGESTTPRTNMGADYVIDDRATLRENPPDILLTNYRMLDFLLMRPEDKPLWAGNGPETLRYLVLDELHTYDGAQGSDVASLIRRLQARLGTPEGFLCPVGTSATVSSDAAGSNQSLIDFAGEIFATTFPPSAVIGEERLGLAEFLPESASNFDLPQQIEALGELAGEPLNSYLDRQMLAWFDETYTPLALAERLRGHHFLQTLLAVMGDGVMSIDHICSQLARREPALTDLSSAAQRLLLQSFLSLISYARVQDGARTVPFLTVQAQIWVREMSRLIREVHMSPRFFWRDDVPQHLKPRGLPAYVCRECGHSGWLAMQREGDENLNDDTGQIYQSYFDRSKNTVYVYPAVSGEGRGASGGGEANRQERLIHDTLCPNCLRLGSSQKCDICDTGTIPVVRHHEVSQPRSGKSARDLQRCPVCATDYGLGILGRQAASLLSVAISHLFTSPLNSDPKLLAFTDSVQDASHRAAFFGARTYRFGLRTAMQAVVASDEGRAARGELEEGSVEGSLSGFTKRLIDYWMGKWGGEYPPGEEWRVGQKLVAAFMPPDLSEMASYRQFLDGPAKPVPEDLGRALRLRLSWEVTMEYGFNARTGRSLEKVGSSLATVDPAGLQEAVEKLAIILPEEIGLLRESKPEAIQHFVSGLLERTRTRGGIVHPLLQRYLQEQGNTYMLSKRMTPLLSPFGPQSPRFPRFLNDGSHRDTFDQFISQMKRPTWYVDWAQRTLSKALGVLEINDIFRQVIQTLVETDILHGETQGKATSYGILPEALLVGKDTASLRCDSCGQQWTITPAGMSDWLGQPCLNYRCRGHFRIDEDDTGRAGSKSYYRALYERGQVSRIFSYEHTGLLTRDVREEIERGFKGQVRADAPNLLTATPTLEMGIDVGDLSATVACTVPPTTANYLQRIGRAGRATGNSLVLTLANVRPHDLYFFEQPLEMIAGSIMPPGCYLDAPNMLKRQYLAFCMDNWTADSASPDDKLPRNVKEMLARLKREGFPLDLLAFVEEKKTELIGRFLALFEAVVSSENQDELAAYALGDELPLAMMKAVEEAEGSREFLRKNYRALRKERDRIEDQPALYDNPEEQLEELNREMRIITTSIRDLEDTYVLNFFTDAGLLPNYAFPETGVKLRAVITGIDAPRGEKGYLIREYVRAASAAIRELAPFNTFYAEGRKMVVNSLNLQGDDTNIERWQFCDRCATMTLLSASHYSSTCPKCGSSMWHDAGQQHDMVRLREVVARTDAQRSRTGDDGDDRQREAYCVGRYFEVDPEQSLGAHLIHDLPFGIEALRQVTLREINFGLRETYGNRISIDGEEQPETGFQVCPGCGVVQDPRQRDDIEKTKHARTCRWRGKEAAVPWQELYLYREMTSEAMRVLLPVSTVLINEKLATFQACLDLGLRRKFQGDPDHLQIGSAVELTPEGTQQRFLMIYDTVPGGTSYLRDLLQPDNFRDLLVQALGTLTSCSCQFDERKEACYRCLYSYHTQYEKEHISRQMGVDLLTEILEVWPEIEEVPSLSGVDMVSLLESELEQKFINALEKMALERREFSWQVRLHRGKQAYQLTLGDNKWLVEPQVNLGILEGVSIPSKPDFVFWPQGELGKMTKPVAVFTDGFAYHVQPNQAPSRLPDDLRKRQALIDSGEFHVWSIVWDDVVEFEEQSAFPLTFLKRNQRTALKKMLARKDLQSMADATAENGVRQLLRYLDDPTAEDWMHLAGMMSSAMMIPLRPPVDFTIINDLVNSLKGQDHRPILTIPDGAPPGETLYTIVEDGDLQLLIHMEQEALMRADMTALRATLRLDDMQSKRAAEGFNNNWRQYLLLANIYQFLPGFVPLTSELVVETEETAEPETVEAVLFDTTAEEPWTVVLEYALPECKALLGQLMGAGINAPLDSFELTNERGIVTAMAEFAWVEERTAVFLDDQAEDKPHFAAAGWQTFDLVEELALREHLTNLSDQGEG